MSTESILVTGGAGFVGSHLTRSLLSQGYRVRILDSLIYGPGGLLGLRHHPQLEVVIGDICDRDAVKRATEGVDRVIALAALVGDPACALDEDRTMAVNYESTLLLMDACRTQGVHRLVFASSCSTYGANGEGFINEDSPLNPVSLYAHTRILSEEALLADGKDIEPIILRLATVCGASRRMRFDLMVNTMTANAIRHGRIRVTGASQWRPHIHVQDVAQAFVDAMKAPSERANRIYNAGGNEHNLRIGEVAERVRHHVRDVEIETCDDITDLRSYRVSFARIHDELGFTPRFSVDHAIREVSDLLEMRSDLDFHHAKYHNVRSLDENLAPDISPLRAWRGNVAVNG